MAISPIREGFSTMTPYLLVEGVARLLTFLPKAFNAQVLARESRPDGAIMHAEVKIGDSMLMMGEAGGGFEPMPASIYLYVTNCDVVYRQALQAGATSVFEMMDLPSGERYGGIKDPCGNIWWVATHVKDLSPEEQEEGWREFYHQERWGNAEQCRFCSSFPRGAPQQRSWSGGDDDIDQRCLRCCV